MRAAPERRASTRLHERKPSTSIKGTVLIADDEEWIRELLKETFRRLGSDLELLVAQDGEEALEIARREHPDVVILDVSMPKRNGYQVCEELKGDPATAGVRVVILTGWDYKPAPAIGADCYFSKPWSPIALLTKVKELL